MLFDSLDTFAKKRLFHHHRCKAAIPSAADHLWTSQHKGNIAYARPGRSDTFTWPPPCAVVDACDEADQTHRPTGRPANSWQRRSLCRTGGGGHRCRLSTPLAPVATGPTASIGSPCPVKPPGANRLDASTLPAIPTGGLCTATAYGTGRAVNRVAVSTQCLSLAAIALPISWPGRHWRSTAMVKRSRSGQTQ